ncbi:carbon-nitrogen hydrolase family protein [Microbacterium sp.]|uniref:carbon-nitrogen hydrolase family protein n=1 Tax=Microbacterium sp. TaxID=51671 RepID=UPI0025F850DB|nr:carbon-nitrogen hydrolase family protein [Microbacterium sp.]
MTSRDHDLPRSADAGQAVTGIGVAVAQFAPTSDREANLQTIEELTARAAARGARVVLFPEYSSYFVQPFDEGLAAHAEDVGGRFTQGLCRIAAANDAVVVAGLLERSPDGGRVRNAVVAVDGDGVRATYRKLHLYDAFGQRESDWVEPGEIGAPETFELAGIRFALMTCYDLRFPEVARTLADAGAHVVLVAAEWVRGPLKEHHWRTLLHARAIENTLYVAAADHPPPVGVGASMIVDPQGIEIAGVGIDRDIAVAWLDAESVARVRLVNPALELRRFGVHPRA